MNIKNKLLSCVAFSALGLAFFSFQVHAVPSSRKEVMIAAWERAKAYTREYLEAAATQDVYDFKPKPEMRSFGEQMHHLAVDNYKLVHAATDGLAGPGKFKDIEKEPLKTKAEITQAVMESYDYVIEIIKSLDEAKLDSMVKMFNKWDTTLEEGLDKAFEHQTHHRGQTTVYLRLKGITPPKEKLF
jgi:uncharacterized damage-inducible protein DinB